MAFQTPASIHRALRAAVAALLLGSGVPGFAAVVSPAVGIDGPAAAALPATPAWAERGRPGDSVPLHDSAPQAAPDIPLPAPAALWLFGSGLGALALARRRLDAYRRRRAQGTAAAAPPRGGRTPSLGAALRQRIRHVAPLASCPGSVGKPAGSLPKSAGGPGGLGGPFRPTSPADPMGNTFEELAAALEEQPQVARGRRFGRACVKFGKRPFLVLDHEDLSLAFRVGEEAAIRLQTQLPQVDYWNPKQERQPKRSWLACRTVSSEVLVLLTAAAYEQAIVDSNRGSANDELPLEDVGTVTG